VGQINKISRRDFLKFAGVNLAGLSLRGLPANLANWGAGWPGLRITDLPAAIRDILRGVPETIVPQNGYLYLVNEPGSPFQRVPFAPTQWNQERSQVVDELFPEMRWGLVLHWYGDPDYFDRTVKGYLRGFNSLRRIADFESRTSAHFLVGDGFPDTAIEADKDFFGILQTQRPSPKGVPYLASHLNNFAVRDFEGDQYFVNALYKLGLVESTINPVLQDLFEGPKVDPNFRTIAIEITGFDFDDPKHFPTNQKIANVLSVVWALMKRYRIRAIDILGHHEIQVSNADPGKKFMALMRMLLGIKALVDGDAMMKHLVFGPFLVGDSIPANAVQRYFAFVRNYLVLVGLPIEVYEWETRSKFWFIHDQIAGQGSMMQLMDGGFFPLQGEATHPGSWYLDPDNHEGIDIYTVGQSLQTSGVRLAANGACMFIGENRGFHHGKVAGFRHRQSDGAELLTLYGHMRAISDIKVGKVYPAGYPVGQLGVVDDGTNPFLHFSAAYGATWDTHLSHNPNVPLSANAKWIRRYFLHPEDFLKKAGI
jgi:hypothetical protein